MILKQFIIKYEHFVQGQLYFTKKIIQQKLLESDLQHELWFEITFTYASNLQKKKKISSGIAVVLLKFSGVTTLTHHMSFFKVKDGYLKGPMKLSCTLLWR